MTRESIFVREYEDDFKRLLAGIRVTAHTEGNKCVFNDTLNTFYLS